MSDRRGDEPAVQFILHSLSPINIFYISPLIVSGALLGIKTNGNHEYILTAVFLSNIDLSSS